MQPNITTTTMATTPAVTGHEVYSFYSKKEYLQDITRRISQSKPGDRVALATMSFEPQFSETRGLIDALGTAAARGVQASLVVDAYIFLKGRATPLGPLFFHADLPATLRGEFLTKHNALESLRAKGVTCAVTNQPRRAFSIPVAGRSHIKFAVINDRVYLGGCNLDEPDNIDMMVGWDDAVFSEELCSYSQKMISTEGSGFMNGDDITLLVSDDNTVFVDTGKPRQSVILDQAIQLIDQAQKTLLFVSQFFPNGPTANHLLLASKRGVDVTILFNHPSRFNKHERLLQYANIAYARTRLPQAFFANQLPISKPYLHAKIIATESAALIGSHNYIRAGVNFGTAEIALLQHDPNFARALRTKIMTEVDNA